MTYTHKRSKKSMLRRFLVCLALMLAIGVSWSGYCWYQIEQTLQKAAPTHADVGIVLGAAVWGEKPSPSLQERLNEALSLYQDGYVPYLLVSGGLGEGKKVTEAAAMRNYLIEHGVPAEKILLESQSTSTYENLLYSQQVMEAHNMRDALIISHDYHLARAVVMADSLRMSVSPVGIESKVLFGPYHRSREVLALTHWEFSRFLLHSLHAVILA
ncbi:YdcF family protein [Brevibacillus reuszeri]|uniref:YdcF family protein n=1 Tax=Brevibacillus reuszeri TaxID=54915 RepID=UPI00289795EE|nr:YdcF family protein [Brevibacillus reuszeri]